MSSKTSCSSRPRAARARPPASPPRGALEELQDTRNAIAHGEAGAKATKHDVARYAGYVRGFADAVDEIIADRVERLTGDRPW
jgi:hypothetical protein